MDTKRLSPMQVSISRRAFTILNQRWASFSFTSIFLQYWVRRRRAGKNEVSFIYCIT